MTPEQDAVLRDIQVQLRGPSLAGWPQLGVDAEGRARSLVDGLAAALRRIDDLTAETAELRAQITELRTEISELEAGAADLADQVQRSQGRSLPWPLSLIEGPVELIVAQLARLEALLAERPSAPEQLSLPCRPGERDGSHRPAR
ncbi:hypothetical protein IU449_13310 [Nocardia higoensis]|uniref:Uncharacterized protein n=1 Tax=Nocardia higoensis TaxID=228599 RepID=A0ABS0DAL7_9NOCA|nr:hypothetical protein [Nocardia higoensis]MBF6355509.1 hypothetical protein [Nocardia higoensis]